MSEPTALYRLFDRDGKLLYVGITKAPTVRFVHHKMEKTWWPDVARKDIEWLNSREEALKAEVRAIHQELPFWNVSKSLTRAQARRAPARKRVAAPSEPMPMDSARSLLGFTSGRFRRQMAERDKLRKEVASAIRAANTDGLSQKDIAEVTGYTRQQVRRIVLSDPQDA